MSLLDVVDVNSDYKRVLEKTRAGQQVQTHIVSMEHMRLLAGKTACAQQQCGEMARILMSKLKANREWLGLPAQLPRAIAFLHLSGETVLVHSDAVAIVRAIVFAGASATDHRLGLGVEELLRFAEMHGASLLLTLSLPWQAGTQNQYWELRTVRENAEGELVDGEQCFNSRSDEVQEGSSITHRPPPPKRLVNEIARNFEQVVRAVCIDASPDDEPPSRPTTAATEKEMRTLRDALRRFQDERKEFHAETRELKRKHTVALREHTEKAASELAEEHMRLTSAEAERDRAQTTLLEERQRSEEKMRSLRAELVAKEEELEKAQAKIEGAKELREAALKAERAAVQTLAHEREKHKLHLEDFVEGSERRVSELTLRVSSLGANLGAARQDVERKEGILDGVRCERDALQFEVRQLRRDVRCTRALLALGVLRTHSERAHQIEERRVAKEKLDDARHKAQAEKKKAAAARRAADEVVAEARRAAQETATPEATPVTQTTEAATVPVPVPVPVPVLAPAVVERYVDFSMNTEPLPDPPEVAHLQGIVDAKHTEIDALKEKLVAAEAKAGSGGVVFGGDPAIDALLEGLAIESRRLHQQLCHAAHRGGPAMAQHSPYDAPAQPYYNPMLTQPQYYNYQ